MCWNINFVQFGYFLSFFSPLLKSIARPKNTDYVMVEQDPDERDDFIAMLESRFFFLAADARSTLRLFIYFVNFLNIVVHKHEYFVTWFFCFKNLISSIVKSCGFLKCCHTSKSSITLNMKVLHYCCSYYE